LAPAYAQTELANRAERRQLSEEAAAFIRESIMSGRMRSGEFVRIRHVAEDLDLSATPVREALHLLRAEGFVELAPNKGFRVAPLTDDDVRDIFQLFAFVAGELCARAAERVADEIVAELEAFQERLVDRFEAQDWQAVERLNFELHRQINRESDSPKLASFLRRLNHYIPRRFYASIDGWPTASLDDHAAILDALSRRDSQAARTTMSVHILHAGELLAANLAAHEGPG
jgi:DNA-binding GntR family transcriptional regulator